MMINLDAEKIVNRVLAKGFGLDRYNIILNKYLSIDISKNINFQKLFTGFYGVRRNGVWRETYYKFFEERKHNSDISFEEVIRYLLKETGNIEASFSSKLIATINPNNPIWDQYILKSLNLKLKTETKDEQVNSAIALYEKIKSWYEEFISSKQGNELIEKFDMLLPDYRHISKVKKVDAFLWQNR